MNKPKDINDLLAQMQAKAKEAPITIRVVPNEYGACPRCGAYWGHPDKSLDYPNRSKVCENGVGGNGLWWWRCYNPNCTLAYYCPDTGEIGEDKPTPEEEAESRKRAEEYVANMMRGKKWVTREIRPGVTQSELVDDPASPDYKQNRLIRPEEEQ